MSRRKVTGEVSLDHHPDDGDDAPFTSQPLDSFSVSLHQNTAGRRRKTRGGRDSRVECFGCEKQIHYHHLSIFRHHLIAS